MEKKLEMAVISGDVDKVIECVLGGADPNYIASKPRKESSLLAWASCLGSHDLVKLLASRGADLEHRDEEYGMVPLLEASGSGHCRVIALLLELKCERKVRNKLNNGALMLASLNGCLPAVQYLVENDFSVNETHQYGRNSLHVSAQRGHVDVSDFLLRSGAHIESIDENGKTPFLLAADFGRVPVIRFLMIQRGCNRAARNKDMETALHLACRHNHAAVAEFLVQQGADVNARDKWNERPFENAKEPLRSFVRFARLYAEGTITLECLKICFIGEELAGKTTLAEAIQRGWFRHLFAAAENARDVDVVADRTAGMKVYRADIASIGPAVVCDFAGQELYLGTHTLFFDESNSFFILLLSAVLKKSEMLRQGRRWLGFLRAALRRGAFPVVVIAVSRADACDRQQALLAIREVVTELQLMFQSQVNIQERFFLLDCRKSQSTEMREFRDYLGQLRKDVLQTVKKYPRLCQPVISKLLPRLRKQDVPQMVTKSDLTAIVKKEIMPAQESDVLDDTVEFLHVSGEVFLLDDLVALSVPWLSCSLLGPVMASHKFPVHLKAAESRREEGTATKEELSTVLKNFQVQQGKRPENINTEYAISGLKMLGVVFELSDRPGVYCIPAHLPNKDRNEMWPEKLDMVVLVGRREECMHEVDVFTKAFFAFFQSKAASYFEMEAILWSGGIVIPHVAEADVYVECLVELSKETRAVDVIVRGREKSERHCLAFLSKVYDMLVKTMAEKSPGTETRRYLLHLSDIRQRKKEPIGFPQEYVEAAAAAGKAVVVRRNEGQVIEAHLRDLMATHVPPTAMQGEATHFTSPVLQAVQKHGSTRWFALALAMGYSMDEANAVTRNSIHPWDSLMAIFWKKVAEAGRTTAEESLLVACKDISPPIDAIVREELNAPRRTERSN